MFFPAFDLYKMASEGHDSFLYDASTEFFMAAAEKALEEEKSGVDLKHLFGYVPESKTLFNMVKTARKIHDHQLDKKGPVGHTRRTNLLPFDEKLRKKKKFKKDFKPKLTILDRETMDYYHNKRTEDMVKDYYEASSYQADQLCRGKQLRVSTV